MQTVPTTASNGNGSERKYHTRYGIKTAPDAARELVERSWSRLR